MIGNEQKELIVFDLDGTLTESKSNLDSEMAGLLSLLLAKKRIAVVSGCSYGQFQGQFVKFLSADNLENLFLFPTCATRFFRYESREWQKVYEQGLTDEEKQKIFGAFEKMFQDLEYKHPEQVYGEIIEDRGSQLTFSAYGQKAPLELKKVWDPDNSKRLRMKAVMEKYIPEFEIRVGGTTSIDVTMKGIDKGYAIAMMEEHLKVPKDKMLFIGDALFPGGNDYPVKEAGVECVAVKGPEECKEIIEGLIKESAI